MLQNQENVSKKLKEVVLQLNGPLGMKFFVHIRAYKTFIVITEYTSDGDFYGSRRLKESIDYAYYHYAILCDYKVKYRVYSED